MKKIDFVQSITILANAGVIAGIVFLGFELRQNTEAIRVTSSQNMASELANFNLNWITPDIAELSVKVNTEGYSSLSAVEKEQLGALDLAFLLLHQNLYYQYRNGTLDPEVWSGRHRTLVRLFGLENFREKWRVDSMNFIDQFREYIDNDVLSQPGSESAR